MLSFSRLLGSISLSISALAATIDFPNLPPGPSNALVLEGTLTDSKAIADTIARVDQKAGATGAPNQPVPDTAVTAVDGTLTDAGTLGTVNTTTSRRGLSTSTRRRSVDDYELVFGGTGVTAEARDASIQGTAYLTFTLVPNSTYNVDACLSFCDSVKECVFANLYYEYNNDALDHRETSNLKCAVYGDTHTAAEKTNWGGQQLEESPAGLTYIQQSSGWSAKTLVDPEVPEGYEHVFGPTNGANNSPGYMGFAFLDRYDVDACAQECNKRGADGNGGACQYFNIWRAVVNGSPTTYTCSMYFVASDQSTATNTGQGSLQVTYSRGYKRKNFVVEGDFEGGISNCGVNCWSQEDTNWIGTSAAGGSYDATIVHWQPYAHSGYSVGILGDFFNRNNLSGTLKPKAPLSTVAGKKYTINFFQASTKASPTGNLAYMQVLWNGQAVSTISGYAPIIIPWKFYSVEVTAIGNDVLSFYGGNAPAWSLIDDIAVYETY